MNLNLSYTPTPARSRKIAACAATPPASRPMPDAPPAATPAASPTPWLERRFAIAAHGSTWRREVLAGVTTFLAMVYITVVNPTILADAGMDFGAVFVATCLTAAAGTLAMGLFANYPVALAPGMGQNAFFAYTVVIGMATDWRTALGAVFLSGVLFVALSALRLREWLINAIPKDLKLGVCAGVGFFIALIALKNAGVVTANDATLVALGDLTRFGPLAALAGFVVIAALMARRVPGAIVVGMLAVAVVGWTVGAAEFHGVLSLPPSPLPVLLELDILGAFRLSLVAVILSFLIVDVFDTAGTLVGVATRGGLVGADGKLPRLRGALLADSGATVFGALAGTSAATSYIESAAGVESGGRTGLTAVVVAGLFLLSLVFAPLAQSVPPYATSAALLLVAMLMARGLADLKWNDVTEATPAVVTALAMPLSFSVADGIGLGFLSYAAIKLLAGRARECPLAVYAVAVVFGLKFALL